MEEMKSCPTVLIGMVLDVSKDIRHVVMDRRRRTCRSGEETEIKEDLWDTLFTLFEHLIQDNELCVTRTFAFGTGVLSRNVRGGRRYSKKKCPKTFDILRTVEEVKYDPVLLRVWKEEKKYTKISRELVVGKVMNLLEENGAHNVKGWASNEEISKIIDERDQMSPLFLAALKKDTEYVREVIQMCLPEYCKMKTVSSTEKDMYKKIIALQSVGLFTPKEIKYLFELIMPHCQCFDCIKELALMDKPEKIEEIFNPVKKEKDIRKTADRATTLWHKMHPPPEITPIETGSALFRGAQALELLKKLKKIRSDIQQDSDYTTQEENEILDSYFFGETCLIETLEDAVKVFKNETADKKILLVFSAGMVESNRLSSLKQDLKELEVDVVCGYISEISPDKRLNAKTLYCKPDPGWLPGCRIMYELSSTISTRCIPRTFFLERDWTIEVEDSKQNKTKLFAMVNNIDEWLDDVSRLINEVAYSQDALSDILESISLDVFINTVTVNDSFVAPKQEKRTCYANAIAAVVYMAMKRIPKREADPLPTTKDEKSEEEKLNKEKEVNVEETVSELGDSTYAAEWKQIEDGWKINEFAIRHLLSDPSKPVGLSPTPSSCEIRGEMSRGVSRVPTPSEELLLSVTQTLPETGYPYYAETDDVEVSKNFLALREEIIKEYGHEGANTATVLKKLCRKFRLRTEEVGLKDAMKSISNQQPVVATLKWTKTGEKKFDDFFKENPKGILRAKNKDGRFDICKQSSDLGHAVVLTSYNTNGLKFMNSKGTEWGDNGFFTLAANDHIVDNLKFKFYTVFYEREDLTVREQRIIWTNFNLEPGLPRKKSAQEVIIDKYSALKLASHECEVCKKTSSVLEYKGYFAEARCPKCDHVFNPGKYPELVLGLYLKPGDLTKDSSQYGIEGQDSSEHGIEDQDSSEHGIEDQDSSEHGIEDQDSSEQGIEDQDSSEYGIEDQDSSQYGIEGQYSSEHGVEDQDSSEHGIEDQDSSEHGIEDQDSSELLDYKGYYAETRCPKCDHVFHPGKYPELVLGLYLKPGDLKRDSSQYGIEDQDSSEHGIEDQDSSEHGIETKIHPSME